MTNSNLPPACPPDTEAARRLCDLIVERAATMAMQVPGATLPMILDRFLSFAAAQAVAADGVIRTAEHFRDFADRIDHDSVFAHLEQSSGGARGPAR